MQNFTAHRLRFVTEAQTTIELNEHQGSAIRGSLFHALRNQFCAYRQARECAVCPLVAACPVATLVSTLKPGGKRGRDVPRPYTIQPPLWAGSEEPGAGSCGHPVEFPDGRVVFRYEPRERFEFGLTLYAQALQLFPYVILAVHGLERGGDRAPDGAARRSLAARNFRRAGGMGRESTDRRAAAGAAERRPVGAGAGHPHHSPAGHGEWENEE